MILILVKCIYNKRNIQIMKWKKDRIYRIYRIKQIKIKFKIFQVNFKSRKEF
jgi:hypothetical protein